MLSFYLLTGEAMSNVVDNVIPYSYPPEMSLQIMVRLISRESGKCRVMCFLW